MGSPLGAHQEPTPSPPPVLDAEVKAARSYLEGWFGGPMTLPPIQVVRSESWDGAAAPPGHYRDGLIRLRPDTLGKESELRRVLRHEMTHAIIDQKTKGNCPHWLQEGIAQFLDGTDVVGTELSLRKNRRPLTPLFRLEGPFFDRDLRFRQQAYLESASAVSFLVARVAKDGLLLLIQRLGEGRPFDRALLEIGLTYTELQQAWEASLAPQGGPK